MTEKTKRALQIIKDAGADGIGCSIFGAVMWEKRKGRVCSVNGGGDYAAQMLLGRLCQRGLVRVKFGEGSSRWVLTADGAQAIDPNESAWTQSVRKRLDVEARGLK